MTEDYYKEVSIDSILPDHFPDVAVYLKTGSNYMLYKPHGSNLTADDHERLQRRGAEYIYVRTGDMDVISAYQENNLPNLLQRQDLKSLTKGKILFQTCADFVAEVFKIPHKVKDVERCRNLVRQITRFVTHDKEALVPLKVVAAGNPYQIVHNVQVATLTLLMHTRIFPTINGPGLEDVGIGAILHDLGMSFGDTGHAGKSESLSHHEYHLVKQHASTGYDYLNRTGLFSDTTLAVVHHHHERYDGKGYPDRLNGNAISKGAQVAALCDSFCAMTSDRIYRKAVTASQALQTMRESKGAYDPELFRNFEKIVMERKA
jgi:HD-GYP domain-containing protein (c-di-GMP phosphodiesterase class II)